MRRVMLGLLGLSALAAVWLLYYGGRYLQHEDPLQKADAIFVLAGTRLERPFEAVDLYKEGYAPIIVLSPGRPEAGEARRQERGRVGLYVAETISVSREVRCFAAKHHASFGDCVHGRRSAVRKLRSEGGLDGWHESQRSACLAARNGPGGSVL